MKRRPLFSSNYHNNTLHISFVNVGIKDIPVICALYDHIRESYTITPNKIEVSAQKNKRWVKKRITFLYTAISDHAIKRLEKRFPIGQMHTVKNLFSHIEVCATRFIEQGYQRNDTNEAREGNETKDWTRHCIYKMYMIPRR